MVMMMSKIMMIITMNIMMTIMIEIMIVLIFMIIIINIIDLKCTPLASLFCKTGDGGVTELTWL